jgi:hypothetical protein
MNKESTRTQTLSGDLISENPNRGVFGRRRRTPSATASEPVIAGPSNPATAGQNATPPAGDRRPLRRWSVAELIARAVAAPSPDGISHG